MQMRHLRLVGVAILATVIVAAVAASAAYAEVQPLFTYSGSGAFTIKQVGAGALETSSKTSISCTGGNGTGQFGKSQATTAELTVTFTGCTTAGGLVKCTTTGLTAGNIQTVRVLALLLKKEPGSTTVLIKLHPKTGTAFLAETSCGGLGLKVTGAVIGEVTPTDKQTKTLNVVFKQAGGLQEDKKAEGETGSNNLISTIGEGGPEEAGLGAELELTLISGSGQLLA